MPLLDFDRYLPERLRGGASPATPGLIPRQPSGNSGQLLDFDRYLPERLRAPEAPPPIEPIEEPGWLDTLSAYATPSTALRLGAPIAGGLLGSIVPGVGTAIGATAGAALGGALGEYGAEKMEGVEDVDPGEIALAGGLSAIPAGPIARAIRPGMGLLARAGLHGLEGASQGLLDVAATTGYREGRLPTGAEMGAGATFGAALGGPLGLGFEKLAGPRLPQDIGNQPLSNQPPASLADPLADPLRQNGIQPPPVADRDFLVPEEPAPLVPPEPLGQESSFNPVLPEVQEIPLSTLIGQPPIVDTPGYVNNAITQFDTSSPIQNRIRLLERQLEDQTLPTDVYAETRRQLAEARSKLPPQEVSPELRPLAEQEPLPNAQNRPLAQQAARLAGLPGEAEAIATSPASGLPDDLAPVRETLPSEPSGLPQVQPQDVAPPGVSPRKWARYLRARAREISNPEYDALRAELTKQYGGSLAKIMPADRARLAKLQTDWRRVPEPPKDQAGNPIIPGQEDWTPQDRTLARQHAEATLQQIREVAKAYPVKRTAFNSVGDTTAAGGGYETGGYAITSHKDGTVFEDLPYTEPEMTRSLRVDKGNPIEQDVLGAALPDAKAISEQFIDSRGDAYEDGTGDATFDPAKFAVRKTEFPAGSPERDENFRRWFGGSKVVDPTGKPLVVHHGSGARGITEFDPGRAGSVERSDWGEGIYFTPSKWMAEGYRESAAVGADAGSNRLYDEYEGAAKQLGTTPMNAALDLGYGSDKYNELQKHHDRWIASRKEVRGENRGETYATYVNLQNPLIYKYEGMTDPFLAKNAKANGHDGIIIRNDGGYIDEVIAFRPEQIKSVDNRGTFDSKNPNIKFSVRPSPGQRGLEGIGDDVPARQEQQKKPPAQQPMFGQGALMQGVETRTTEGREAEGALFTQEQRARERAEAESQGSLLAGRDLSATPDDMSRPNPRLAEIDQRRAALEAEIARERPIRDAMGESFPLGAGFGRKGMSEKGRDRLFNRQGRELQARAEAEKARNVRRTEMSALEAERRQIESGGETAAEQRAREATDAASRKERSRGTTVQRLFMDLKVGDEFNPGGGPLKIIRKNRYSVTTEGGTTWSVGELTGLRADEAKAVVDSLSRPLGDEQPLPREGDSKVRYAVARKGPGDKPPTEAPRTPEGDDDYRGQHGAPMRDSGAPAHDLTGGGTVYPDDVYGPNAVRYYGDSRVEDRQSIAIAHSLKGRPNAPVTIYRAVPHKPSNAERIAQLEEHKRQWMRRNKLPDEPLAKSLGGSKYYEWASREIDRLKAGPATPAQALGITPGDWVTINRQYAKDHGEGALNGQYKIVSKRVRAKDIFTNGDSIHEWGYDPSDPIPGAKLRADDVQGTSRRLPDTQSARNALTPQHVKRAFPTGNVQARKDGSILVDLPNGSKIVVRQNAEIHPDPEILLKDHPDSVDAEGNLLPGMGITGAFVPLKRDGIISLAKMGGDEVTLRHESFHAAMHIALSPKERAAVLKHFGDEEKAADAYAAWKPSQVNSYFSKILQFFRRIYRTFSPNWESAFEGTVRGDVFNRQVPAVDARVFGRRDDDHVLRPVVGLDSVDVMDVLRQEQLPAKRSLHDQAMLRDLPTIDPDVPVASADSPIGGRAIRPIREPASVGAELLLGKTVSASLENRSTSGAGQRGTRVLPAVNIVTGAAAIRPPHSARAHEGSAALATGKRSRLASVRSEASATAESDLPTRDGNGADGTNLHYAIVTREAGQSGPKFATAPRQTPDMPPETPATGQAQPAQGPQVGPETMGDKFIRVMQDKFIRPKRYVEAAGARGTSEDFYRSEELFHGRTEERLKDAEKAFADPIIKGIADSKTKLDDLDTYLKALDAKSRNAAIKDRTDGKVLDGSGWSDARAAQTLADFAKRGLDKRLDPIVAFVRKAREKQIEVSLDGGLISKEQAQAWNDRFGDTYVPWRTMDVEDGIGTGHGYDIRGKEAQSATGRSTEAGSPTTFMLAQLQRAIVRAEKNKVAQTFAKFAEKHPDSALWEFDKAHTTRTLDKSGKVADTVDFRAYQEDFDYKVDGEAKRVTIKDPLLLAAMKNMGAEKTGEFMGKVANLTRMYSSMVTSYSPEFILTNPVRDIQAAIVNVTAEQSGKIARQMVKNVPAAVHGIYQSLRDPKATGVWAKRAKEFREDGGSVGFYSLKSVDQLAKNIESRIKGAGPGTAAAMKRGILGIKDWVEDANKAMENGTRLAVYSALRDAGASREKAASVAKNVTLNFNRKGEAGPAINALYAFANANIQGTKRLIDVAVNNPRGRAIAGGIASLGLTLDLYNRSIAGDKNEDGTNDYDDIPEYVKDRNIVLVRPNGKPFLFPMPYGFNVLITAGRQIGAMTQKAVTPQRAAISVASSLYNAFNPLGGEDDLVQIASPTFLDPLVQHATNKNFAGKPIMPTTFPGAPKKPDSEMYFKNVSPWARDIAGTLNKATGGDKVTPGYVDVSPETIQHFSEFLTGGMGRFLGNATAVGQQLAKGEDVSIRNVPFARRFQYEEHAGQAGQKYRENVDELETLWGRYRSYYESKDTEGLKSIPVPMLRAKRQIDAIDGQIRRMKKALTTRPDLQKKIEELQIRANRITASARRQAENQ